jgi:hypothetical protein
VANKIIFYLKLAWLCLSLGFKILWFAIDFLLQKINQKKAIAIVGISLISFVWVINFYIFYKKNTPQVELVTIQINDNGQESLVKQRVVLEKSQVEDGIKIYKEIEEMRVKNLGLLLNLNQLNKALNNEDVAQKYLDEAKAISPNLSYLEN